MTARARDDIEEPLDIFDREHARQARRAPRRDDRGPRVARHPALAAGEAIERAQRGDAAGDRRARPGLARRARRGTRAGCAAAAASSPHRGRASSQSRNCWIGGAIGAPRVRGGIARIERGHEGRARPNPRRGRPPRALTLPCAAGGASGAAGGGPAATVPAGGLEPAPRPPTSVPAARPTLARWRSAVRVGWAAREPAARRGRRGLRAARRRRRSAGRCRSRPSARRARVRVMEGTERLEVRREVALRGSASSRRRRCPSAARDAPPAWPSPHFGHLDLEGQRWRWRRARAVDVVAVGIARAAREDPEAAPRCATSVPSPHLGHVSPTPSTAGSSGSSPGRGRVSLCSG